MLDVKLYKKYLHVLKNYLVWVFKEYVRKDCPTVAASMTLTSLFAIVPVFFIIINVLNSFDVFNSLSINIQDFVFENMLPATATTVQHYIVNISNNMGTLPVISVLFVLLIIFMMIKKLEVTLNKIFYVKKSRPVVQSILVYWALMTMGPFLLGFVFISSMYVLSMTWFFTGVGLEQYLLGGLSLLFLIVGFFVIYKILPNTRIDSWVALVASIIVAIVFTLAKKIFSLYMFYVPTYSVIYGSLSLIPIFILWIFLTWHIVLVGAVMIRGIQYMSVTLNFNKSNRRDDISIAVNILKELYTSQKNLINGVSISDIYKSTSVADYDKIKKILYALESKSIIRMSVEDQCYLNCDVFHISLRKIYASLDPSLNFNKSSIRKVNAIKTELYSSLDVKLHECF